MHRSHRLGWLCVFIALGALVTGCGADPQTVDASGTLQLSLELDSGAQIHEVAYEITSNGITPIADTIDTSAAEATASVEVFGLPPGDGYLVAMSATSVDGDTSCGGKATFNVTAGQATRVMVTLHCKGPPVLGAVRVDGTLNVCAQLDTAVVSPLQTSSAVDVRASGSDEEGHAVAYRWTAEGGSFADPSKAETTFTCGDRIEDAITIEVSDDDFEHCLDSWTVAVRCVEPGGDLCEEVDCDDENECTEDVCNPATGLCENTPREDGSPCTGGTCQAGTCQPSGWCRQNPFPQGNDLLGVSFTDANTGTAVGSNGTILRTTDGGATWVRQDSGTTSDLYGVSFTDANNGVAVGVGIILRTTNGGTTWVEPEYLSWEGSNTAILLDVSFADAKTGTAVGGWGSGAERPESPGFFLGAIVHTTDGGASWGFEQSFTNELLRGVSFAGVNIRTAVGTNGTILRTTGGWIAQDSGTTSDLYDVSFTDANTGVVVGGGTILRTTNGGATWELQQAANTCCSAVSFTDANTGTAVGGGGTILRTTDGGATWVEQNSGITENLYDVSFTDANNGTAVGTNATILRTTDGGGG